MVFTNVLVEVYVDSKSISSSSSASSPSLAVAAVFVILLVFLNLQQLPSSVADFVDTHNSNVAGKRIVRLQSNSQLVRRQCLRN